MRYHVYTERSAVFVKAAVEFAESNAVDTYTTFRSKFRSKVSNQRTVSKSVADMPGKTVPGSHTHCG